MTQILCSTGALIGRPNGRNYRLLKEFTGHLHCDGYEFMMYDTWYSEIPLLINTLQTLELNFPVMHCEKNIGEAVSKREWEDAFKRFECNCSIAEELGCKKIVMHLWDGLTSDAYFENNLNAYPYLREIAEKHNTELLIENVVCNQKDPFTHWYELRRKYPDIGFIFDTKMAAFHGQMEEFYSDRFKWLWMEQHIRHFHVNDYAGGYKEWSKLRTLPIGDGNIDFSRFFRFIQDIGYTDTFTVESTVFDSSGRVDLDMLNRQFAFMREHLTHDSE